MDHQLTLTFSDIEKYHNYRFQAYRIIFSNFDVKT